MIHRIVSYQTGVKGACLTSPTATATLSTVLQVMKGVKGGFSLAAKLGRKIQTMAAKVGLPFAAHLLPLYCPCTAQCAVLTLPWI